MTRRIFEKRGRDRLFIIAEILDIATHGVPKTVIMGKANLSYPQMKTYLMLLLETRLLRKVEKKGRETYHTTPKGHEYSQSYREALELAHARSQVSRLETPTNRSKCPTCGKGFRQDFIFCPYCGRQLQREVEVIEEELGS